MTKQLDESDFWLIPDNPISKVGVFDYLLSEVSEEPVPPEKDKVVHVFRSAAELNNQETIDSFKLKPIILGHTHLGAQGENPDEVGVCGVIGEQVYFKDGYLLANLKIFSETMKNNIMAGVDELSCGFTCYYIAKSGIYNGIPFDYLQTYIRGNHLAVVPEGRAGHEVKVMDNKRRIVMDSVPQQIKDRRMADTALADALKQIQSATATALKALTGETGGEEDKDKVPPAAAEKDEDALPDDTDAGTEDKKAKEDETPEPVVDDAPDDDGGEEDGDEPDDDGDNDDDDTASTIGNAVLEALGDGDEPGEDARCKGGDKKRKGGDRKAKAKRVGDAIVKALKQIAGKPKPPKKKAGDALQAVYADVASRDAMVNGLKPLIGTFNYSGMTASQVALYGAKKLGLTAKTAGDAKIAVMAFIKASKQTASSRVSADSAPSSADAAVAKKLADWSN